MLAWFSPRISDSGVHLLEQIRLLKEASESRVHCLSKDTRGRLQRVHCLNVWQAFVIGMVWAWGALYFTFESLAAELLATCTLRNWLRLY